MEGETPHAAPLKLNAIVPSYVLILVLSLFSFSDPGFEGLNQVVLYRWEGLHSVPREL